MTKRREFVEGEFYHVTSRTNDKIRAFENSLGRKIMLIVLRDAKDRFRFDLANPAAVDGVCYGVPPVVSRLLPPEQLDHLLKYPVAYADSLEKLAGIVPAIPKTVVADTTKQAVYLRYFSRTADYLIHAYDVEDAMFGTVRFNAFPSEADYRSFNLSRLKSIPFMQLDFSWGQLPEAGDSYDFCQGEKVISS